ncbi:uncharacterized protein LOC121373640 [Gigantopelta aegis]|uniref:uncharacterized protein LOC121373640 n=1 Tax=Gigantopelta aegis TaxID=1735272 RepID=UPI001B88AA17|nr:uncharacterized protein LOC121373640 [Gigantopelta aegis]
MFFNYGQKNQYLLQCVAWLVFVTSCCADTEIRVIKTFSPVGPQMCLLACQRHGDCDDYEFTADNLQCVLLDKMETTLKPKVECGNLTVRGGSVNRVSGIVQCGSLFEFYGQDPKATCTETGEWKKPNGSCERVRWINETPPLSVLVRRGFTSLSLNGTCTSSMDGFEVIFDDDKRNIFQWIFKPGDKCDRSNQCNIVIKSSILELFIPVRKSNPFFFNSKFYLLLLLNKENVTLQVNGLKLKTVSRKKFGLTRDVQHIYIDAAATIVIDDMKIAY